MGDPQSAFLRLSREGRPQRHFLAPRTSRRCRATHRTTDEQHGRGRGRGRQSPGGGQDHLEAPGSVLPEALGGAQRVGLPQCATRIRDALQSHSRVRWFCRSRSVGPAQTGEWCSGRRAGRVRSVCHPTHYPTTHPRASRSLAPSSRRGVHALSIVAKTPTQWAKASQISPSPPCLGGSNR